ncbi:MAG: hypothetical protein N2318_08010, partial [Meiothermus sp.]|nr:hypothetical protein [Meiothermus sp.]
LGDKVALQFYGSAQAVLVRGLFRQIPRGLCADSLILSYGFLAALGMTVDWFLVPFVLLL